MQFLSDPTGNRRWLPFEVVSIDSPRDHPFDYENIYAQAYALYRQGFRYWFTREEIEVLPEHNRIYGLTDDGRTLWQTLLYYRRLQHATPEQREDYEMDDEGIHWYQLDEDVSFESFEYDNPEPTGVSLVFLSHPELNAAAVGRRLGISQSLMAQYINGTKKPSKERERMIMDEIANIASELQSICA